jgi:predicted AlkP superfamily phosphohydrolase/phosphomutase
MIVSDRGLQANHGGHQLMEEALVRMGFMARRGPPAAQGKRTGGLLSKHAIRQLGRRVLPERVRHSLKPWYRRTIGEPPPVDETRSQVFFEPGVSNSYLRVNLVGREPNGIVHPAEYNRLLRRIQRELYALVDSATGTPVVNKVYYPQRMYPGGQGDSLPDVSIDWSAQHRVDAIQSSTIGVVEQPFTDQRSGSQRNAAFLLCHGPGFRNRPIGVEADARQLAPTVFCLLGELSPRHYQLGPISDALRVGQVVPFEPQRRRAI